MHGPERGQEVGRAGRPRPRGPRRPRRPRPPPYPASPRGRPPPSAATGRRGARAGSRRSRCRGAGPAGGRDGRVGLGRARPRAPPRRWRRAPASGGRSRPCSRERRRHPPPRLARATLRSTRAGRRRSKPWTRPGIALEGGHGRASSRGAGVASSTSIVTRDGGAAGSTLACVSDDGVVASALEVVEIAEVERCSRQAPGAGVLPSRRGSGPTRGPSRTPSAAWPPASPPSGRPAGSWATASTPATSRCVRGRLGPPAAPLLSPRARRRACGRWAPRTRSSASPTSDTTPRPRCCSLRGDG